MKYSAVASLFVGALTCLSPTSAQMVNVRACSNGIQADGFVDWTKLPTVQPGAALNATIPVTGIPGLTVTVQIPSTPVIESTPSTFMVMSPIDLRAAANGQVILIFNHPVRGVSTSIGSGGRFQRSPSMSAYTSASDIGGPIPPDVQVTASVWDHPSGGDIATTPLQIRSEGVDMGAVVIQFPDPGSEYLSYDITNLRVESGSGPDASKEVPANGLKQWLRADSIYQPFPQVPNVPNWPDQSGNHADATAPGGVPSGIPDGPNCAAVVRFAGTAGVSANLPINGWSGMTVFLVSQSANDIGGWWENQPLFWGETALWGTTFVTPSQSNVFFRFGTEQVNNQPIYARPVNFGGDYSLTTAVHDGDVDRLYVNGVLALREGGKRTSLSGVSSTEWIGAGLNNSFFTGAIGEILVYDRALSERERDIVEHYLMKKFGLF
jgi:hypothetical protein